MRRSPGITLLRAGTWQLLAMAILAAVFWLLLLGAWPQAQATPGPLPAPAPGVLPL